MKLNSYIHVLYFYLSLSLPSFSLLPSTISSRQHSFFRYNYSPVSGVFLNLSISIYFTALFSHYLRLHFLLPLRPLYPFFPSKASSTSSLSLYLIHRSKFHLICLVFLYIFASLKSYRSIPMDEFVDLKDFIVELSSDTACLYIIFMYRSLRSNAISFHASKTKL